MDKTLKYVGLWVGRFRDSFSACSLAMTQGDVTALTLDHMIIAGKTGFTTAVAATTILMFSPHHADNKWVLAGITGFITAMCDLAIHQSHFGGVTTEAMVTGIGAGLLTLAFSQIKAKPER